MPPPVRLPRIAGRSFRFHELIGTVSRPHIKTTPRRFNLDSRVSCHVFNTRPHSTTVPRRSATMAASNAPTIMPGVVFDKTGGTDVLQYKTDLPVPQLKEGEVLVKNEFVGVNYIDIYFRSGLYPSQLPNITGQEASGTVVSAHPSTKTFLKPGDRVVYLHPSTYAAYTAVPAHKLITIPSSIQSQTAAAVFLQGLTALTLIRESAGIPAPAKPAAKGQNQAATGPWTLVHAAAGGTGLMLVQLLALSGARVIAAAGSEEKCAVAKAAGAGWTVVVSRSPPTDGSTPEWVSQVQSITNGHGVDAIFDGVGASTFKGSMAAIARKGTMVSFGNASGNVPPVDIRTTLAPKCVKLLRPQVFGYLVTREELEAHARELLGYVEGGLLDVKVHEVYPLKDVGRAHDDLEGRGTMGKLVLKVE